MGQVAGAPYTARELAAANAVYGRGSLPPPTPDRRYCVKSVLCGTYDPLALLVFFCRIVGQFLVTILFQTAVNYAILFYYGMGWTETIRGQAPSVTAQTKTVYSI